jgi:hypothetical protein
MSLNCWYNFSNTVNKIRYLFLAVLNSEFFPPFILMDSNLFQKFHISRFIIIRK